MKGGGLVVVLFVIVFVFLFICTLWGVRTIVGGICRKFSTRSERHEPEIKPQVRVQVFMQESTPDSSVPATSAQVVTENTAAPERADPDDMDYVLRQLERMSRLREEGTLTEAECSQIKENLFRTFNV